MRREFTRWHLAVFFALLLLDCRLGWTAEPDPQACGEMEVWDYAMSMCMPLAMPGMPMRMLMLHGNAFLTETAAEKPRGRDAFSMPDYFMLDLGQSLGQTHYLNLDFMGTVERWTYPEAGTPELLQIGETRANGQPYLDAQHPHSSPIMGLTLSDTITLGHGKDHFKFWFAPRGESTDGPVAFMHRPTGQVNPEAPLGHHIGQDVGHISSTVFGGSLRWSDTTLELSTFNGTEPVPWRVDLPIANPDSYAARLIQQFTPQLYGMVSAAVVKNPEPNTPLPEPLQRYSASLYGEQRLGAGWQLNEALIWGVINNYDSSSALNSYAGEFWLHRGGNGFWGRLESLQRTPAELLITTTAQSNQGQWVAAATLGYTRTMGALEGLDLGLGGSFTQDFLPADFRGAYGGNPVSALVFLQLGGMKMWAL